MANIDSVNYKKITAKPSEKISAGQANGDVKSAYDQVTTTMNAVAADIIRTGIKIPKGALVKEVVVIAPINGGTVSCGISGTPTKYLNAGAAGSTHIVKPLVETAEEEEIIGTIGGSPSATGTYKFSVSFVKI